jgi:DNA-directed RNA polymerase subunit RPC12/RpoP
MTEVPFYRCVLCRKAVSPWDIKRHRGCPHCGHTRMSPTNLTLWEKAVQIMKHPAIWRWGRETSL